MIDYCAIRLQTHEAEKQNVHRKKKNTINKERRKTIENKYFI